MEREIKFRAFANNKMIDWNEMLNNQYFADFFKLKYMSNPPKSVAVLMQFTGLKDKTDKDIYEGDILKCFHNDYFDNGSTFFITVVTFEDGSFWNISEDCCSPKDCVVLGNIHEHENLLRTT